MPEGFLPISVLGWWRAGKDLLGKGNILIERTNLEHFEAVQTGGTTHRPAETYRKARRALLVDDHGVFREVLGVLLERLVGYRQNVQARSLAEARRALAGSRDEFDFAIIDLDLPDEDGFRLIRELREICPRTRVLALTASPDPEQRANASRMGADKVLSTAVCGEEIIGAMKGLARN